MPCECGHHIERHDDGGRCCTPNCGCTGLHRGRAQDLVRSWQRDCQPMCDPPDLQELENRVTVALARQGI